MKQYLLLALLVIVNGLQASDREGKRDIKMQITGQTGNWFDEYEKIPDGETVFAEGCQKDIAKYRKESDRGHSLPQFISAFWSMVTGKE